MRLNPVRDGQESSQPARKTCSHGVLAPSATSPTCTLTGLHLSVQYTDIEPEAPTPTVIDLSRTPLRPVRSPRRTTRALALVGALLFTGCGPSATTDAPETAASIPTTFAPAASTVTQAATAPASTVPVDLPDEVELKTPAIEVEPPPGRTEDLWAALTADGVDTLTAVRAFEATLVTVEEDRDVAVAAVDANAFRPFTPEATAQARAVWERLHAGDALVRHDVAHELGLELGGTILLVTDDGAMEVRIGAFASNGAPPIADIVVPWDVGPRLGQEEINRLYVAIEEDARPRRVGDELVEALGGGIARERERPAQQQAQLHAATGAVQIEPFTYQDNGDGTIVIDPAWVASNIVRVDLPRVGRAYVHRIMAPQLLAAFAEIQQAGLIEHFDPSQFGGGWVARHIDWNPAKPLSMHAWGLAIDLNTRDNALGARPQMNGTIVQIFERWGFAWGGNWNRPDGMHFELARVVTPG